MSDLPSTDPHETESGSPSDREVHDPQRFFLRACLLEGGLVLLAGFLGWILGFSPVKSFYWSWADLGWGLLATVPIAGGMLLIDRYPVGPLRAFRDQVDALVRPMFRGLGPFEFAAISLFAGIGEETLFRGLIQGYTSELFGGTAGPWIALGLASLLFGAMHPVNRMYVFLCVVMGVYFGLLWMWTGNLLAPIVAHAAYDFVALCEMSRHRKEDAIAE